MTCGNCGAPARLDRNRGVLVCGYCGGEFVPAVDDDGVSVVGETHFKCPTCEAMLSEGQLDLCSVRYCTRCRGMLVGMDEFMPLIRALRAYRDHPAVAIPPRNTGEISLPRLCPLCLQPMDNHPYGGAGNVVIDTCERCSVNWLDKGELHRIVAAPDYAYSSAPALTDDADNAGVNERNRDEN